jgi:hypothetical protein
VLREVRGLHISSEALAPREATHEREGEELATEAKPVRLTHGHEAAKAPQSPLTPQAASLHADVEVLNDPTPSPVQSKDPRKGPTQAERAELTLVAGMQAALKTSDFAAALALCAEHERGWPHGVFAMEREGVRAIASCAGGSDGARVVAQRFLAKHAHTTLALRVKAACVAQLAAAPRP